MSLRLVSPPFPLVHLDLKDANRSRAGILIWWVHSGHTYKFCSTNALYNVFVQLGHCIHTPSGISALRPLIILLLGINFSNQLIVIFAHLFQLIAASIFWVRRHGKRIVSSEFK